MMSLTLTDLNRLRELSGLQVNEDNGDDAWIKVERTFSDLSTLMQEFQSAAANLPSEPDQDDAYAEMVEMLARYATDLEAGKIV